jgi:class 3 adenylate cyclase
MNFCGACGAPLVKRCPKCGLDNAGAFRFCGRCGSSLADGAAVLGEAAPAVSPLRSIRSATGYVATAAGEFPEGERKTVTAMFADIKGSTELMEDLDPEEARDLIDPALELMIEAVRRYDGYIVQSTGDGIFALFGAPMAHEDHPQRAVHAALRMQAAIREYAAKLRAQGRAPTEIRVGINSGEVVVREIRRLGILPIWLRACRLSRRPDQSS